MKACVSCFRSSTWIANASPSEHSPSNCSFGHGYSSKTWPTYAWVDSFSRLLAVYEIADNGNGESIESRIRQDWDVLQLSDERSLEFLSSVFPGGHPLLLDGVKVRLRSRTDGLPSDHTSTWEDFSMEIRNNNRYFPKSVPDKDMLSRVLLNTVTTVPSDTDLYRARIVQGKKPTQEEMGAPPRELARPGRANSFGIPHLYLAYSDDTCIRETRASTHATVAIGRFRPIRSLLILNLADIEPPDFFSISDIESIDDQVAQVSFHRLLVALSEDLRKPARSTDHPIEYVPTQYICDLAKSLGIDGILYLSSLHAEGRNVVLFDPELASCVEPPKLAEVVAIEASWRYLGADSI